MIVHAKCHVQSTTNTQFTNKDHESVFLYGFCNGNAWAHISRPFSLSSIHQWFVESGSFAASTLSVVYDEPVTKESY